MSIGPHRSSYGFSTIPSTPNSLPRQHMMNTPAFQQVMTLVPLPNSSLNTQSSNHSSSSNSSNGVSTPRQTGAGGNAQTMYCDNCQTFRHISFFQDKTFKYSVCRLCDEREMQKRIVNKERYEQYEEQQKNLKQSRYPIPQSSYSQATTSSFTSQAPPIFATHPSTSSPPQTSSSAQLSIQLPQMPITLGGNNSANLPPPPNLATPTSSNSSSHPSPQMNASSNMILGMNMNSNKAHLFPTAATTTITATTASTIATPTSTPTINNIRNNPMHQTIQSSLSVPNPLRMRSTNKTSSSQSVDLISLDEFVQELRKHVDFDRKLFHLNIQPLIEELGPSAGFSQIGRGICEKVLEGTRFNFSLKDRRKSTKSPETLSTLRYYCSQRSDTAKPRKAEHPKAQLKYNCAGALTIIIDLSKKSANVSVIHKHAHPPFISHHQPKTPNPTQRQPRQEKPFQQDPQQRQRMLIQKQQQTNQRFDTLKQQLNDIELLLESQRRFGNEDFLDTATEALSDANEMVQACKALDNSDITYPVNKYTLHFNKRGDDSPI